MLGILWAAFQPLSMMLLFTFIFKKVMPTSISTIPYPIFFYAALLPWNMFSASINSAIPSLVDYYNLITKIYFPREILPLSGIAVAFVDFCIASFLFLILLFWYKIPLTVAALWFFPLAGLLVLFTISVGLVFSALNVYYRDVKLLMNFILQFWFFATPIIYSIDRVSPKFKTLLYCNPLTFIVENMRRCVVEGRPVPLWQFSVMSVGIGILMIFSYLVFKKTEKKFADVI